MPLDYLLVSKGVSVNLPEDCYSWIDRVKAHMIWSLLGRVRATAQWTLESFQRFGKFSEILLLIGPGWRKIGIYIQYIYIYAIWVSFPSVWHDVMFLVVRSVESTKPEQTTTFVLRRWDTLNPKHVPDREDSRQPCDHYSPHFMSSLWVIPPEEQSPRRLSEDSLFRNGLFLFSRGRSRFIKGYVGAYDKEQELLWKSS